MAIKSKHSGSASKKALLKKIIKGKKLGKSPSGASPIAMDGGLGKSPLNTTAANILGGGGSNLGGSRIF